MTRPKVGICYQRYDGNKFLVHGFARHTETNQELIIHQDIKEGNDQQVKAAPISKWFDILSSGAKRFVEIKQRKE